MTEAEWLASDDPSQMLRWLCGRDWADTSHEWNNRASERKLRLFADTGCYLCQSLTRGDNPVEAALYVATSDCRPSPKERASIIRDIFRNPFRPGFRWTERAESWASNLSGSCRPAEFYIYLPRRWMTWKDCAISRLAQAIYDERRFEDMPILADALEEAGCTNEEILNHARQSGPHVRGCWVLDLLLGKS